MAGGLETYEFPVGKLAKKLKDNSKIPVVLVACGSYSPITYLHLRMFEMAKDYFEELDEYELIGGYFSPVSDFYQKEGLVQAVHRVKMCELATDDGSDWLMVDEWESLQHEYQRTAVVLDHFHNELNKDGGVVSGINNDAVIQRKKIQVLLLAGGDLIKSMETPGVWELTDLRHILKNYGCMVVERTGTDLWEVLLSHDVLYEFRKNIHVVKQAFYNDISSTKVRMFVKRKKNIKYLLPDSVIEYIYENKLYTNNITKKRDYLSLEMD
ncbi:Nicotinamide/nicotinic acid mononucleotide adenylyltransferase 1 [Smittium culicis]|uniref:Nicotinamide-nucleotide adenylyltransferase n=2 Tax=Smittium culicis TaxID=133412 RepID=A0A1R1XSD6_9FUNG|nr:Nicotinamide/nicotinic acid mononucleotide adenylyltransferase 1 [Smittium culicis]